jgi:hypothetical protein
MAALYKIQVREHPRGAFRDYVEWCPCSECIRKLHAIFDHHPDWDLRVVDETEIVVTSTLEQTAPYGMPRTSYN